jgi:hypothetical protein
MVTAEHASELELTGYLLLLFLLACSSGIQIIVEEYRRK